MTTDSLTGRCCLLQAGWRGAGGNHPFSPLLTGKGLSSCMRVEYSDKKYIKKFRTS